MNHHTPIETKREKYRIRPKESPFFLKLPLLPRKSDYDTIPDLSKT